MNLADEYKRQFGWRAWPAVLEALPPLNGQTVVDLGCGVGDIAAELAARGARVIGIDLNEELLGAARERGLANADFRLGDLHGAVDVGVAVDGLWCSFAAAYFPDLSTALSRWAQQLRPGGWVALTEIDDLFAHEPISERTRSLLEGYAREALATGRYDFQIGRKLADSLARAGFHVAKVLTVPDAELAFDGPAHPDVARAWAARLERMKLLRDSCGADFERLREELLACLTSPDHRSTAKVYCCIGAKNRSAHGVDAAFVGSQECG